MESASSSRRLSRWSFSGERAQALLKHAYLLPVLLIAAWLRFSGIGNEHLYGDEAEYSIVARYLSRDFTFLAYPMMEGFAPTPFVSQPPLILYVMGVSMKIFGATDFAALLPSILFGIATVGAVYALGLRLGGRFVALGAAALLAVLPFHVEMSRRAMLDAGFTFFLVLTAYFLVAWLQTRSRKHAIGVGVATAATCLSKLTGVLAGPIVLSIFLLALGITIARHARGRAAKGELQETLVQGGIATIPIAVGAALYLGLIYYLEAMSNLWLKLQWQLGRVDTSQVDVREMTVIERDASFYLSDPSFSFGAQLGAVVFALALVGLALALWRFASAPVRRTEYVVVPVMVLILAAFLFWSDRKEGFYLVPFAPFAALMVANAASGLKDLVAWAGLRYTPRLAPRVALGAILVGALLIAYPAVQATGESYNDYVEGDTQEKFFGYGTKEAALWIHERDPEATQFGTLLGRFTLHWYNEQPSYHWYVDHTMTENAIQSGELKYIVYDEYLNLQWDEDFMRHLINKYNGQKVAEFEGANWAKVTVFELHP